MAEGASFFSDDVAAARAGFLAACDRIGLRVDSFPGHDPADGRAGRGGSPPPVRAPFFCDVARLGSPEATRMLVLFPAAGGGAGFAGAGVVQGVLAGGLIRELPREVACLLVHAVNPTGSAWPPVEDMPAPPKRPGATPRADWSDGMLSAAERRFAAYEQAQRFDRERLAGRTLASLAPPAWGREVLESIAARHLAGRDRLLFIDVRTGPGPFGEIERIAPRGGGSAEAAARWTGLTLPGGTPATSSAAAPAGGLPAYVEGPGREKATVMLEAGTYSMATLLQASGPISEGRPRDLGADGPAIAAYPRETDWREGLWRAASDLIRRGFKGLAEDK